MWQSNALKFTDNLNIIDVAKFHNLVHLYQINNKCLKKETPAQIFRDISFKMFQAAVFEKTTDQVLLENEHEINIWTDS